MYTYIWVLNVCMLKQRQNYIIKIRAVIFLVIELNHFSETKKINQTIILVLLIQELVAQLYKEIVLNIERSKKCCQFFFNLWKEPTVYSLEWTLPMKFEMNCANANKTIKSSNTQRVFLIFHLIVSPNSDLNKCFDHCRVYLDTTEEKKFHCNRPHEERNAYFKIKILEKIHKVNGSRPCGLHISVFSAEYVICIKVKCL